MSFRVGQKVVCVNAQPIEDGPFGGDAPVEGTVYTVVRNFSGKGEPHIELAEIKNYPGIGFGYRARRFRPLVEHKTDISVFTAMLTPKRQKAKA